MRIAHIASSITRTVAAKCVFSLVLMGLSVLPGLLEAAPKGRTETLSLEKAAPAVVVIETAGTELELRRQMRTKNGVTELKTGTVRFSEAATNSYGFIAPKHLGLALVMQIPDLVLERTPPSSDAYEIHKLADGSGLLVGFLGKEIAPEIKPSERPKNIRISLYSNPAEKAPFIVAVPFTKLVVDQMPRRVESKKREGPVLLEMDLQGTANRKALGK